MHKLLTRKPLNSRPVNFQRPPQARVGKWYEIKNVAQETAEVAIYDEIGYWGVTASEFIQDIQGVGAKNITLKISSPGGDVFDGLNILNALRQHPANITVVIEGLAASAASFIAMAGDKIQIAPNAMVMIHEASGVYMGNAQDMQDMYQLLDKTSQNIASIYAERAGGDAESWREAMRVETWYTHDEAVAAGLADEVLGLESPAAKAANQTVVNQASDCHEPDETTTEALAEEPGTTEPEAFDFVALLGSALTAAKEATARG